MEIQIKEQLNHHDLDLLWIKQQHEQNKKPQVLIDTHYYKLHSFLISDLHRDVNEICVLLEFYPA